jgi:hypothetical protein
MSGQQDTHKLVLPPELLAEVQRRGLRPRSDLHVEQLRPPLLQRVLAALTRRRRS